MKDDREFIKEYRSRKLMLSEVVMKKRFPDILEQIKNYDIANNLTASSFPQMLYNWLYRLKEHPKCPITNQDVLFDKNRFIYKEFRGKGTRSKETQAIITEKRLQSIDYKGTYEKLKQLPPKKVSFQKIREIILSEFYPVLNFGGFCVSFLTSYPEIYNYVNSNDFMPMCESFTEKMYCILNNMEFPPVCVFDNENKCTFKSFTQGYSEYGPNFRLARKGIRNNAINSVTSIYDKKETVDKINEHINLLKNAGKATNNLFQTFTSVDSKLTKSILSHTEQYEKIKFSNRVFLLINGEPSAEKSYIKPVFHSLDKGYDMRFENSRGQSKPEKDLLEWLSGYIDDLKASDRTVLDGKEIDIYSESHKIGIEFNGIYWHNYDYTGKDAMINKTMLAKSKDVQLLHILDTEWIHKQDIVKSVILSKFGIYDTKIYARKCEVKVIDSKIANLFLDHNHLQGKDNSKIKLGLYHDNELVSVMTFGSRKITSNNDMELIRFCNRLNTTVIGGASKLFKFFLNNYNFDKIKSYANLRISDGGLYKNMGFELVNQSAPNYWYFKPQAPAKLELKHRSGFQKHRLSGILENFDSSKTEWENMKNHGFCKIYDCGTLVFEYKKP